jgi:hypothetical protein
MSHVATNWAFAQKGLKPAAKLVLLCLADRHNPDHGCFPEQATLARDAVMSRSSVNNQLKDLETLGLIRRIRIWDEATKRQKSTRYILAFEDGFIPVQETPCPKSGHGSGSVETETDQEQKGEPSPKSVHGAVSKKQPDPCPKNGDSRVQNLDTNPVRVTSNRTRNARAREAAPAGGVDDLFDRFCQGHPNAVERNEVWSAWTEALEEGANPARLVVLAQRYSASPEAQRGFPKKAQNWLRSGIWQSDNFRERPAQAGLDDVAKFWAEKINDGKYVVPNAITEAVTSRMLELALVTRDQLRMVGVSV